MKTRIWVGTSLCVVLSACQPPVPELGVLSSPVLTAERKLGKELVVALTYDTKKTPCGTVPGLRASLDGVAMNPTQGPRTYDENTGEVRCEFPAFSIPVTTGTAPREIVLTDDVTAQVSMTIDTLNSGSASPESPPATLRPGYVLRWSAAPPPTGTSAFSVVFIPEGGSPITWTDGPSLPTVFSVTVPQVTAAASGVVAATWLVNTSVTNCAGLSNCTASIQGAGTFNAVVAP